MADDALHMLADHFGIGTHFHDVWGQQHAVAQDDLAALLTQFDVDPATPEAALHRLRLADWREALPPVLVVDAGADGFAVRLRVPMDRQRIDWQLTDESGRATKGSISRRSGLPETGRETIDGIVHVEHRLEIRAPLPLGYHRLRIEGLPDETLIIAAPSHCHRPEALEHDGRLWGLAVQLYGLRSGRNWGIGDFSDLARFVEHAARLGAGVVGLNPLHALFTHDPSHASPYSPSSRLQINALYVDVEAVEEFRACTEARARVQSAPFQARLAELRAAPLVDYPGVAAAKFEILTLLHAWFAERRREHEQGQGLPPDERSAAFDAFRAASGDALRRHALFEALQEHFHGTDPQIWGWPVWPEAFRDPSGPAVAQFAHTHAARVEFFEYVQWQAALQLAAAAERCAALDMPIGLYLDLAVSVDRAGSDVWGHRGTFAAAASIGAPPDAFNAHGQNWGLPPWRPDQLRRARYGPFIDTLRAGMRIGGALRIDHVMGLMRLFWIPPERDAHHGAYVRYPFDEMLAIVALESRRHRCLIIGEDLGTVSDETRSALARYGVLSYRLLYFERDGSGSFRRPPDYPRNALVAASTHDLATLAGWWASHDLGRRFELGLFPGIDQFDQQLLDRAGERVRLLLAVREHGTLPAAAVAPALGASTLPIDAAAAIQAYLAAAPSKLMMVQLEDAAGEIEQPNLPGTTDQHPNWRRRQRLDLDAMASDDRMQRVCEAVARMRPAARRRVDDAACPETLIPGSTYRLQFHRAFGFDDAVAIVPYLAQLGVTHVYCSPIQRARPGSLHGYDVVAHGEINPELGGMEGFERFTAALKAHGMGQLLDLVPNHMGVLGGDNPWWLDVLENGPASPYAQHFDIDWQPLDAALVGKVLVPVLGDRYGDILDRGELVLVHDEASGRFAVHYHDHRFPLAPQTYPAVLKRAEARVPDPDLAATLASIATAFQNLPGDVPAIGDRIREKTISHGRLARLTEREATVRGALAAAVNELNRPDQRDALHALLEMQSYRLAYWRVASDEINYRRFFDINELAAIRMELEPVFDSTQSLPLDLAARGWVDGLRIDHPDGLYDPAQYFERLQQGFARRRGIALAADDAQGRPCRPLYVVAEKISAPHEKVPESWHIHGTTGYVFAHVANGVLVDTDAAERFDRIWRGFTGQTDGFDEIVHAGKRAVAGNALASELTVLASELLRIARADRRSRDYTLNTLRRAVSDVVACLPVYRTYIVAQPSDQDVHYIDVAVTRARQRSDMADPSIFEFIRTTLLGQTLDGAPEALRSQALRLAIRFQQFSAPVAAKGVEDTAFYRYFPLSALNEVGGDPAVFGLSLEAFHDAGIDRARRWPHTMLATSTHDNKRSEDVRNRIDVLSEMPAGWRLALRRWRGLNIGLREAIAAEVGRGDYPSAADEYLFYQTVLGTLPPDTAAADLATYRERIVSYLLKAARESKRHTSWTQANEGYETALERFVRGALRDGADNAFLADLRPLADALRWYGALNSLTLTLLKYTSPGVPDLYQGNELLDDSLVDPDNRRPVDYLLRQRMLDELNAVVTAPDRTARLRDIAASVDDGRAKLWFTWRLLQTRARDAELFRHGDYTPLEVRGERARHVIAFMRQHEGRTVIVVAARFFLTLATQSRRAMADTLSSREPPLGEAAWDDTVLVWPAVELDRPVNALTGEPVHRVATAIPVGDLLRHLPGCVLIDVESATPS
ncbi:MAG: malto-oligosyltrehalose synthase [Burkholderiales bacterium]|nr:malto-oligosyltrehalose synthase [Burkholderiales bacterium]